MAGEKKEVHITENRWAAPVVKESTLPADYRNHLNRLLSKNGFGPQHQGVTIDWDGLDATLREHYRKVLAEDTPGDPADQPSPGRTQPLGDQVRTRKRARRQKAPRPDSGQSS